MTKKTYLIIGSILTLVGLIALWSMIIHPDLSSMWFFIVLWTFVPGVILVVSGLLLQKNVAINVKEPSSEQIRDTLVAGKQQLDRPGW